MLEESLKNEDDMISSYYQTEDLTDPDDDANAILHDIPYADESELQALCTPLSAQLIFATPLR